MCSDNLLTIQWHKTSPRWKGEKKKKFVTYTDVVTGHTVTTQLTHPFIQGLFYRCRMNWNFLLRNGNFPVWFRKLITQSRRERIKNEHTKEIMGVKGKQDIMDSIEKERLQWYGHVKRMPEDRIPKLIMEWTPTERRKSGCPRKTWIEGVQAAMATRNLEPDQWRNREEWSLVCGRWRQLLWSRID